VIEITDSNKPEEEAQWEEVTIIKDCHILAGALKAGADLIISIDRKHILTPKVRAAYPLPVMEPGDFLSSMIVEKEEHSEERGA
jgi:hypothetical protein